MLPGHVPKKSLEIFQWPMLQLEGLKFQLKKERAHVLRKLKNHHHMALTAHEEE